MLTLRPYQRAAIDALWSYFDHHKGNPLLVLPTASGKSVIQAVFLKEIFERFPEERVLLVSHVQELLEQNTDKLRTVWPDAPIGLYSAGLNSKDTSQPITVASIQSVYKHAALFPDTSLIIIDEAHRVPTKEGGTYRRFIGELKELNPTLKVIGMSATPFRLDTGCLFRGKRAIFSDVAYQASIKELIDSGYLCPLISRLGHKDARGDISGVGKRQGEFVSSDLEKVLDAHELVQAAVDEIVKLCANRKKWLVFCCSIAHAEHVCDELRCRGVNTACVTGLSTKDERRWALDTYARGGVQAMTNVNVLTTGFDAPDIDAIIMLRPTLSPGLYCQMVGRGMRLHESKQDTLVLDFAGNILRHGPIDRIIVANSWGNEEGVKCAPQKECPSCSAICPLGCKVCDTCGHVFVAEAEAKHDRKASDADILSGEDYGWEEVTRVEYKKHVKFEGKTSLRVIYWHGIAFYTSEWVALEHFGYARDKAVAWWTARLDANVPHTIECALALSNKLRKPTHIKTQRDGKWRRVVDYRFAE